MLQEPFYPDEASRCSRVSFILLRFLFSAILHSDLGIGIVRNVFGQPGKQRCSSSNKVENLNRLRQQTPAVFLCSTNSPTFPF